MRPIPGTSQGISRVNRGAAQQRAHLIREVIEVLVFIALIFGIVRFTMETHSVGTDIAMQPQLKPGQLVLFNKAAYFLDSPKRGDVILFANPTDKNQTLVRRVIGIPGDTITLTATNVIVNGVTLKEPYISVPFGDAQNPIIEAGLKLEKNQYYVLGDSRVDSTETDSRTFRIVPRANIFGKAVMVYWPLNSIHFVSDYSNVFSNVPNR